MRPPPQPQRSGHAHDVRRRELNKISRLRIQIRLTPPSIALVSPYLPLDLPVARLLTMELPFVLRTAAMLTPFLFPHSV